MENKRIENEIVTKYVKKNKQERILWELSNPKKREKVFWKFSGVTIFKENCLKAEKERSGDELTNYLFQLGGSMDVYYIGTSYVGILSLEQAVARADKGEICIIYCGRGFGYYQGEQECGKVPRFLLIQQE